MVAPKLNIPKASLERFATTARADFRFSPFNVLVLVVLMLCGLIAHAAVSGFTVAVVVYTVAAAVLLAAIFRGVQVWEAVVVGEVLPPPILEAAEPAPRRNVVAEPEPPVTVLQHHVHHTLK